MFAKYLSLYLHIFIFTYRGTHTQAHMHNQHTRGMARTRHRSLVERGGRKALLETLHTHKKKNVRKKPISTHLKKRFEHIELPAKLLDYFLRSNKSNINQSQRSNKSNINQLQWLYDSEGCYIWCPSLFLSLILAVGLNTSSGTLVYGNATHYHTLQHTTTIANTLPHTATYCNTWQC